MSVEKIVTRSAIFGIVILLFGLQSPDAIATRKCSHLVSDLLNKGDLISFSVRDPYGNDPNFVQGFIGVFKEITTAYGGEDIQFQSGKLIPLAAVEGPVEVFTPGQLIEISVRNPYGNNPNYVQKFAGVFKEITTAYGGEDIQFQSGKLIPLAAVEKISTLR